MRNRLLGIILTLVLVGMAMLPAANVSADGNPMVSAGAYHTVGLKSDGTVVAVGRNDYGECNVSGWSGIVQVAAGWHHTVGLKSDGTVVAVGRNDYGQCNVSGWSGIVQVAAGYCHTVGLKSDGTVVSVGRNDYGECNVSGWSGIVKVAVGYYHTVGLKSDGTVVAVGQNLYGECNVSGWSGIGHVAAGDYHTVGLKSDGTVVAVGDNTYGQCNVSGWSGIGHVAAGYYHTVGLKPDGTVVTVGDNTYGQCNVSGWGGIVKVAAARVHTVGLKSDGTVVAVGDNSAGQCNVSAWDLDCVPSTPEDFTTYTEIDPENNVTVTSGEISFSNVNFRGTDTFVYMDKGEGHFSGDFEHLLTFEVSSLDTYALPIVWMLANTVDDRTGMILGGQDYLDVEFYLGQSGLFQLRIQECVSGVQYEHTWTGASVGTTYYLKIEREESVGEHGRLYCYIYSDPDRTSLLQTLQLDLHEQEDFRYIYALNTHNDSQTYRASGSIRDLNLQESGCVPPVPEMAITILMSLGLVGLGGYIWYRRRYTVMA